MANEKLYPGILANENLATVVAGSFEVDGTSAPVNVRGDGFSLSRTGVGVFDITFDNAYPELLSCSVSVQGDTANTLDDLEAQVGTYTASTGLLEIFTYTSGDAQTTPAYLTSQSVTTDVHTAATAGWIVGPVYDETNTAHLTTLQSGTPATGQVTVTYSAGVPTLTFAAADSVANCAYALVDAAAGAPALADGNGPRVNFVAVFKRSTP